MKLSNRRDEKMTQYDLVGATGCATGVAHTFMAEEALEKAAEKLGVFN